jgi:integrase
VSERVVVVSATQTGNSKPKKPYPTFPLTPHPNGQWCKKIRGQVHFFGVWADPKTALDEYTRQAADLHAGRKPRLHRQAGTTLKDIANHYLESQQEKAKRGLITPAWFKDCLHPTKAFVHSLGSERLWTDVGPTDFGEYRLHLYDRVGVCAIDRNITIIRSMIKFAYDTDLIDQPAKYGGQLNKPTQKEKRQNCSSQDRLNGKRLFTPKEVKTLLDKAQQPLKAMILLGINGGFGNTDCAELPVQAVELKRKVIDYERPKTAVQRVVPLWPETVDSLQTVLNGERPKARKPEHENLVFLTVFGNPWKQEAVRVDKVDGQPKVGRHQAIVLEFRKLLNRLGLKRRGLGFYALRHTFRTWADETHDQHAIHRIMGHAIPGMSGVYVEAIGMTRLRVVVDHVRSKLWATRKNRGIV